MEIYPIIVSLILGLNTLGSSNAAEITCELKNVKYGIENITPEGKTFFRAGETVRITCSERFLLLFTKESTKTFHCLNDGEWDSRPTCAEIRCEIPRDRRLYYPSYYFYGEMKLDAKRSYSCLSRYRQTAEMATCTRDGWKPDPLCADITCEAPNIPNAKIVSRERTKYDVSSRIEYKCHPGFEPEQLIQITCNYAGKWINKQDCVEKEGSCITPILENGYIERTHPTEDSIFYSCNTGYKTFSGNWWGVATCNNGRWSNEPQCILDEEGCVRPPKVENALIISKPQEWYSYGSHVIYRCRRLFTIKGNNRVSCHNTGWDEAPKCEGSICPPPPLIKDGDYNIEVKNDEVITKVSYSCQSYYVLKEQKKHYSCRDGIWDTPPECLKPCKLTPEIYMEYNLRPVQDNYIRHSDEEIEFDCKKGWHAGGFLRLDYVKGTCSDGKITIKKKCDTKEIFG